MKTQENLFEKYPDVVTIDDLREMLKIGRTLAYNLIKTGEIESVKVGRHYRIQKSKIIQYMKKE